MPTYNALAQRPANMLAYQDTLSATPRNQYLGALADLIAQSYSPERTQQMQGISRFLSAPEISQTLDRLSYGEPLTTGAGMTTRVRPEVLDAAMAVAPAVKPATMASLQAARAARQAALAGGMAGERDAERVIPQIMERGGMPAQMLQDLAQGTRRQVSENKNMLAYRGSHTAPGPDFGAPLHDLTGGGQMYPADVYSSRAAQFYGGGVPYDQKAFSIAQQFKDKPDAFVTIYRAVPKDISNSEKLATLEKQMAAYMKRGTLPKDAENYASGSKWYDNAYEMREQLRKMPDEPTNDISKINPGDWVTLTKEYAKDHGESALRGQYKILSQKVRAKDVWTNADSIHEFGYQPQTPNP